MSTLSTEVRDPAATRRRAADRWLHVGAPAVVASVFIGALLLEGGAPRRDLRIVSAPDARPGEPYAIRGGLYDLEGAGAVLAVSARARLLGPDDESLADASLTPSAAGGFEGALVLPTGRVGPHRLEVCAPAEAEDATCGLRTLRLAEDAAGLALVQRLQTEGQRLSRGSLEVLVDPGAPVELDLRVPGGACQPELPCPVLVASAPPGLRLAVERSGVVREAGGQCALIEPGDAPGPEASGEGGLHRCVLRLADPQGLVHLVLHDAAGPLARRTLQLPVALGMPRLEVELPLAEVGRPVVFASGRLLEDQPLAVDVLRGRRWVAARSFSGDAASDFALTFASPGVHHVFARTSAHGGTAALRVVLVRPAGAPAFDGLEEALASLEVSAAGPTDPAARARWAFAAAEDRTLVLPPGTSSAAQLRLGAGGAAARRRWLAALLIVLAGGIVAFIVARRGLAADAEARALLAEAEVTGASSAGRRRSMTRRTLLAAGVTFLGFVLAAAALLSRGCLA